VNIKICILSFLFIFCGANAAEAKALRCESIFAPTILEIITQIDKDNNQFLLKGQTLEDLSSDFSWWRKRKLRKILNEAEITGFPSEKAIGRYVAELGTVLFGSNTEVKAFYEKSGVERLDDSGIKIIQDQLLNKGLRGTWKSFGEGANAKLMQRFLDKIWTFQNSRRGQMITIATILRAGYAPYLGKMGNIEIPPDLMFKVIRDGYQAHAAEVREFLQDKTRPMTQSEIDAYNTFRKVYNPVAMAIVFTMAMHTAYENYHKEIELQVEHTVLHLQGTRRALGYVTSGGFKNQVYQEAVDGSVKDFIKKWGEPPTDAERAEIEEKVRVGIKKR